MTEQFPIPDDFFTLLDDPNRPTIGYAYHVAGHIKAVSLRPVSERGDWDEAEIPLDIAEAILSGASGVDDLRIVPTEKGFQLVRKDEGTAVVLLDRMLRSGADLREIKRPLVTDWALRVRITTCPSIGRYALMVDTPFELTVSRSDAMLTLILTDAEDPTLFFGNIEVPVQDLIDKRSLLFSFPEAARGRAVRFLTDLPPELDVSVALTRTLSDEGTGALRLPEGRFDDLVPFTGEVDEPCFFAIHDIMANRIIFRLLRGGGEVYDREMTHLPVLMTRAGDPCEILYGIHLDISTISDAPLIVDLPLNFPNLCELYAPIYFGRMSKIDVRLDLDVPHHQGMGGPTLTARMLTSRSELCFELRGKPIPITDDVARFFLVQNGDPCQMLLGIDLDLDILAQTDLITVAVPETVNDCNTLALLTLEFIGRVEFTTSV
jgi:hypothetical protein